MNKEQIYAEIERIVEETEAAINEEIFSHYGRECAKMTAYDKITEAIFGRDYE